MNRVAKWILGLLLVPLLLLGGITFALHRWVGSDDFRARAAQEASKAVGLPVRLGTLSVDLLPVPAVAVDDVEIASKPALTLGRIEARPSWSALLRGKLVVTTLVVRKAVIPQEAIGAIAAAARKAHPEPVQAKPSDARETLAQLPRRIVLDDVTWIDAKGQKSLVDARATIEDDALPGDLDLKVRDGRWKDTQVFMTRENQTWLVDVKLGGGTVKGKLVPAKGPKGEPLLDGVFDTAGVEVSEFTAPSRTLTGRLEAHTELRADLRNLGDIGETLRSTTKFTVHDAVVHGIDLAAAVKTVGISRGGETKLDTLAGHVTTQGRQVNLTNLVASSGALSANGAVAMAADKKLSGQMTVALAAQATGGQLGVPLVVGGTLDSPSVTLSRGALVGAAIGTVIAPGLGTGAGASIGDKLGKGLKGLLGK